MANVYIVLGSTGSGKSSSTRNLNPEETFIINVLGKPLPYKGSKKSYNSEKKNTITTSDYKTVILALQKVGEKEEIKNIILDDARHIMVEEYFKRALEAGYGKFAQLGQHFQQVIQAAKDIPGDKNVVIMLHDDDKQSDSKIVEKKPKLVGKMVEDNYDPLEIVTCTLYSNVDFDKETKSSYQFITNRTIINGVIIPAKSPMGMFDSLYIDNDLNEVFKAADEYYN